MKVVELQNGFGIDSLALVDRPTPTPNQGEALVRMRAWSLNYRDLLVVKGLYNPKLKLPCTPLSDGVGEVIAIGPGVTRFKVGDRVAASFVQGWIAGDLTDATARTALGGGQQGLLAEQVVLHQEGLVHVPAHLTDEEAACLPCAAVTAWHALVTEGQVKAGDSVLVQGTGGVSIFALQFAQFFGARVIATSSSQEKLARAHSLGASEGIDYKETPAWEDRVRALTAGRGVDHVVEVGGAGTLAKSLKAVRTGGRVYLIGVLAGPGDVNPTPILMKNIRVQGIFVGSRTMFEEMNHAISQQQMRPIVDRVFPFAAIRDALHYLESGAHFGKVTLRAEG